ncbi:MAG: hypothetical protein ACRDOU_19100 [Streptosporangiaceae bacterium]
MTADRSDDPADQPDERPDHPADRPNPPADDAKQSRRDEIEPRSRQEAYTDLRAITESPERTEPAGRSEPGARSKPPEPPENGHQAEPESHWEETAELGRSMWVEYKRHWSAEERPSVDWSKVFSREVNVELDEEYDRTSQRERDTISPRMCEVEGRDATRQLVGFDHRLKGPDRIKEKVYEDMDLLGRSPREAISLLPDAVRYTFQYDEARYTQGVWADIARMQEQGFELAKLKNLWSDDQYKGINSQWIEPDTGQRFELQFHTRISFEAKEITHGAYERLRMHPDDALEVLVLEAFQAKVTASVPVPLGATSIPDYSEGEWHDR